VVASVEDAFTILRFVMVLVPEFTTIPPVNERRVEVASPGNGQEKLDAGQVVRQVSPVRQMTVDAKVVEVAFDVVALSAVKFCRVEEAKVTRPPQNCEAVDDVATT
jgi:hypothetical protein